MNIIITGASRGIGFETAIQLAEKGHKVYCLSRNVEPLKRLDNSCIIPIAFDLENFDISILEHAFKGISVIHGIINNAGLLVNQPFAKLSAGNLERMYKVNVLSPYRLIQYFLSRLSQPSHIVNISSMGGVQGTAKFTGLSGYSSSKGAMSILTECLAEELKDVKISVNCLALGAVQTEMLQEAFPDYQAPLTAKDMGEYVTDFFLTGNRFFNGKIIPVALSTP